MCSLSVGFVNMGACQYDPQQAAEKRHCQLNWWVGKHLPFCGC
jgi:hypothetical protein